MQTDPRPRTVPPAAGPLAAAGRRTLVLLLAVGAVAGEVAAGELRRSGRCAAPGGRQHLDHADAGGAPGDRDPRFPAGLAVRGVLQGVLRAQPAARSAAAPGDVAGLRLHRRSGRLHRHQQPRHPGRRRDHRHPARRHPAAGQAGRPRRQDRRRRAQGGADDQAAVGHLRRLRTSCGSATGWSPSATRSASAAR